LAASGPDVRAGETGVPGREVLYLAGEAGIRQSLDLGTGIPTAGNTHEVAQAIAPESRVGRRHIRQVLGQAGHTIQPGPHRLANLYTLATSTDITHHCPARDQDGVLTKADLALRDPLSGAITEPLTLASAGSD
jgi:hypothetical protein